MSQFGRAGRSGTQAPRIVAATAVVIGVLWAWVLVSTVSVLVRTEPSVPLALGMSSWSAGADADTTALAVASSQPWSATGAESWLTVSPEAGTGSSTVRLTAAPNATPGDRSATLVVTSAGKVQTMTVYQGALHPEGTLDLDVTDWDVAVGGGTTVVDVTGAQAWTASVDVAWLSARADPGAGALTLTATANPDDAPRSTLVTVTVTDGSTSLVVTVNQAGQVEAALSLGAGRWSPGTAASSLRVTVASDQTWTATSTQSWVSVDPGSGTGDGVLTIRTQPNTTAAPRTAAVQVTGGGVTRAVHVTQAGVPRPTTARSPTAAPSQAPPAPVVPSTPAAPTLDPPVDPVADPADPPVDPPVDPPAPLVEGEP